MTSRAPAHTPTNANADNSWMRNYEAVEYDVPLLHPRARTDSGDEDDERDRERDHRRGPATASPPTPPKNGTNLNLARSSSRESPALNTITTATNPGPNTNTRLPMPARAYTNNITHTYSHTRGQSASGAGAVAGGASASAIPGIAQTGPGSGNVGSLAVGGQMAMSGQTSGQQQTVAQGPPFQVLTLTTTTTSSFPSSTANFSTATTSASTPALGSASTSTSIAPTATSSQTANSSVVTPRTPRGSSFRSSPLAGSTPSGAPVTMGMNGVGSNSGNGNTNGSSGALLSSSASMPALAPSIPNPNVSGPGQAGYAFPTSSSSSVSPSQHPGITTSASNPGLSLSASASASSTSPPTAFPSPFARPGSRGSAAGYMQRLASSEAEGPGRASADSSLIGPQVGFRDYSAHHGLHSSASRGSMILYRLSATEDGTLLPPPGIPGAGGFGGGHGGNRSSVYSNSGDSIVSLGGDSKYPLMGPTPSALGLRTRPSTPGTLTPNTHVPGTPLGTPGTLGARGGTLSLSEIGRSQGGLVAYEYNPDEDADADELDEEEEEWIRIVGGRVVGEHQYNSKGKTVDEKSKMSAQTQPLHPGPLRLPQGELTKSQRDLERVRSQHGLRSSNAMSWRGLMNVTTLVVLITALLCLFIVFPVTEAFSDNGVQARILGNTRINATGQAGDDLTLGGGANAGDTSGTSTDGNGNVNGGTTTKRRDVPLEGLQFEVRERRWERFEREQ